jgi:dCTP deaminase
MKIGQLCLIKLSSPADHPYGSEKYGSRYQGQRGPTASRSFLNFHKSKIL